MCVCGIGNTDLLGYYFSRREDGQKGTGGKKRLAQIPEVNAFGMPYLNFLWAKVRNNKYMCISMFNYIHDRGGGTFLFFFLLSFLFFFSFPESKPKKSLTCS